MKTYILILIFLCPSLQISTMNITPQDVIVPIALLTANVIIAKKDLRVDSYLTRLQERHPEWSKQLEYYSKFENPAAWSEFFYNSYSSAIIMQAIYLGKTSDYKTAAIYCTVASWCMVEERYKSIRTLEKNLEEQSNRRISQEQIELENNRRIIGEERYNQWFRG